MFFRDYEVDGLKMLLEGFKTGAKETPFLTISVKDYLWGYSSILATIDKHQKCEMEHEDDWGDSWNDPCEHLLDDNNISKMGIFHGRNGTSLDFRKINTGIINDVEISSIFHRFVVPVLISLLFFSIILLLFQCSCYASVIWDFQTFSKQKCTKYFNVEWIFKMMHF